MIAPTTGISYVAATQTVGISQRSHSDNHPREASRKPIRLSEVPHWYWLATPEQRGLILDWCDGPRYPEYIPCETRILRNWPVMDRDGNIFIAPTVIEYFKG